MSTDIRPEISKRNKYWISRKHYHELKNFCLQYNEWKNALIFLDPETGILKPDKISPNAPSNGTSTTEWLAIRRVYFKNKIEMVEEAAKETDDVLGTYILMGVTQGATYETLRLKYNVPCCRDKYYELYRRFFWLLSLKR